MRKTDHATKSADCVGKPLKLFCFPYAGGSARQIYRNWADELYFDAEVIPVDFPGRGAKAGQSPLNNLADLVELLVDEIVCQLNGPYAFYGHSVGALVCFEVAHALSIRRWREPEVLFVSAFRAPQMPSRRKPVYNLDDDALLDHVVRLGGVPPSILAEPDLLKAVMPILRADLAVSETYGFSARTKLDCPIHVFGGDGDPIVLPDEYGPWAELTDGNCEVTLFRGGHFFQEISQFHVFEAMDKGIRSIKSAYNPGDALAL